MHLATLESQIRAYEASTRNGIKSIELEGQRFENPIELGCGGTKTVYAIGDYAIGVPNPNDKVKIMLGKWQEALQEPANTNRIRDLGLPTNSLCDVVDVAVNGAEIPAIRTTPYDNLGFTVYDAKNVRKCHDLIAVDAGQEEIMRILRPAIEDARILLKKGIVVNVDSINLCEQEGALRLYFNDLSDARFDEDTTGKEKYYSDNIFRALIVTVLDEVYEGNKLINTTAEESIIQNRIIEELHT